MRILNKEILNTSEQVTTFTTEPQQLDFIYGYALSHSITNTTPDAKSFDDTDVTVLDDEMTIATHGLTTGLIGQLTTTDTLPDGLALATNYFVIVVDENTIQFASSLANALAGTPVVIIDQGTGTHTFTPTALAGTVNYQASVDGVNWFTLASPAPNAFTGTESALINQSDVFYPLLRLQVVLTAGRVSATAHINGKGI